MNNVEEQRMGLGELEAMEKKLEEQVQPLPLSSLDHNLESKALVPIGSGVKLSLESMMDIPITLIFEVGRTNITIKQLMELRHGSHIELRNMSVDSIDVRMNETIVAQGETIALQQRYGIRFGEVELITTVGGGDSNG